MNGIILEINGKEAVALTDDGVFQKMKNAGYHIGQIVKIMPERRSVSKLAAGLAGVAAAFAVATTGAVAYYTPTDYVSLDVNPSVEYSVNLFERILNVKAANDDGEEILSGMDLDNMTIEQGIKETIDRLIEEGYLLDDSSGNIVIATSNNKQGKAVRLAAELKREIRAYLSEIKGITVEVDAEAVQPEKVQEAKDLGITPGKLNLLEKLQSSTSGAIDPADWRDIPVKEINKAIKENRKSEKDQNKEIDKNIMPEQKEAEEAGAGVKDNSSGKNNPNASNGQEKAAEKQSSGGSGLEPARKEDPEELTVQDKDKNNKKKDSDSGEEKKTQNDNNGAAGKDNPGKGAENGKGNSKEKD